MTLLACIPVTGCLTLAEVSDCSLTAADRTLAVATADLPGLIIQTTDDDPTNNVLELQNAAGDTMAFLGINPFDPPVYPPTGAFRFSINNGYALPSDANTFTMTIIDESPQDLAAGLLFHNKRPRAYSEFAMRNDLDDGEGYTGHFAMGMGGSGEVTGYDNVAYFYIGDGLQLMSFEVYGAGQYLRFLTAPGEAVRIDDNAVAGNTRLMIYDVDNGTLERVSVGGANSGGAGFKLLRIPN